MLASKAAINEDSSWENFPESTSGCSEESQNISMAGSLEST